MYESFTVKTIHNLQDTGRDLGVISVVILSNGRNIVSHCLFYSAKISENDDKLITLEIQIPDLTLSFARGLKREIFFKLFDN